MTDASPAPSGQDADIPAAAPGALGTLLRLDRKLQSAEVWLCALCLLLMVGLAFAQVLLRTFRTETLQPVAWFDNVARHLVIWVGMLGASLCTAEGRHISIEALPKLFGAGGRRKNDIVISLASLVMVGVLFTLSMIYMLRVQVPDTAALFHVDALDLDVHRWPFLVIVPAGLAIIGWRFTLRIAQAAWMTDEEYKRREEAAEREVAAADAALEEEEAALLLESDQQTARETGTAPSLTPEAARAEVRRALHSDRLPAAPPGPPRPGAGAPVDRTNGLATAAAALGTPATPRPAPGPGRSPDAPGRSTDEIPIYRDIADDGDRAEPHGRHGAAAADASSDAIEPARPLDSSDVLLEPPSGIGTDPDDAVERLADTERLKAAPRPDDEAGGLDSTDRLPRPDLPGGGDSGRTP